MEHERWAFAPAMWLAASRGEINATGKRFESELQLHDRRGRVIGAVGSVVAYKAGDDEETLHRRAEKIRVELEKRIPDAASLFRPAA